MYNSAYTSWGWTQPLDLTTLRSVGLHPGQPALLPLRPLNHHSINHWPVLTKRATWVQHQHLDDHMLFFVACYKGNLSTKLTKWDSVTARPCVYNGTSTVWPKRRTRFLKCHLVNTAVTQQGQAQGFMTGPEALEREGRRMGSQICPFLRKLGRENGCLN